MREFRSAHDTRTVPVVVFDFGGVLMDWNPRYLYRTLFPDAGSMERFLAEVNFDAWNLEQDRGRPFREGVEILCRQFPDYREYIEAYHRRWEESIAGPIHGTVQIVHELEDAGFRLFGLSNWSAETFGFVRDKHAFFDAFEMILLSGEIRLAKPDPAIFRLFLERTGLDGPDCIFIDDIPANLTAASGLGFEVIRFVSPDQLREELAERGLLRAGSAPSELSVGRELSGGDG